MRLLLALAFIVSVNCAYSQMITGVWRGKSNRQKVEVKIIQVGDSLRGTSYYHDGPRQYRRYSIRGYFDALSNEAVWWDDQLIEEKPERSGGPGRVPLMARADFNCPGDGRMMLNGKSGRITDDNPGADLNLDKTGNSLFPDEWDYVIDNFTAGANDPYIIDSIGAIAFVKPGPVQTPVPKTTPPAKTKPEPGIVAIPAPVVVLNNPPVVSIQTPEQKFKTRTNLLVTEIPLAGDSIELRFYDNAEIDGDSISLFLNERLIFSHIRLTGQAYKVKLAVTDLANDNQLVMVAENLGTIPPNTSYMVAEVNGKRYEARLESTEGSSAMIRLYKP